LRGKPTLFTDQHGGVCGGYGAQACPTNYQWADKTGIFTQLPRPKKYRYTLG
jgi:hypothetical protein